MARDWRRQFGRNAVDANTVRTLRQVRLSTRLRRMRAVIIVIAALAFVGSDALAQAPDYCKSSKISCSRNYGQRFRQHCEIMQANPAAMNSCQSKCFYKNSYVFNMALYERDRISSHLRSVTDE